MKAEEMIKNLSNGEQKKLAKLDSLLRTKEFRERLKTSPSETLRSEGFDVPKDAKFVFTEDDTKIANDNGKDGIFYINLRNYETGYVDSEEFKNVVGGLNGGAIAGIAVAGVAALTAISGIAFYGRGYLGAIGTRCG